MLGRLGDMESRTYAPGPGVPSSPWNSGGRWERPKLVVGRRGEIEEDIDEVRMEAVDGRFNPSVLEFTSLANDVWFAFVTGSRMPNLFSSSLRPGWG